MSREVRRVPSDWYHPYEYGSHVPLFGGSVTEAQDEWDRESSTWGKGLSDYQEYAGTRPLVESFMPDWEDSERTHFQMYETVSEGTPVSPVMESPEVLARWLVDNEVYAGGFGAGTASYEGWLRVANGGYAPSAVGYVDGPLLSGVDGFMRERGAP